MQTPLAGQDPVARGVWVAGGNARFRVSRNLDTDQMHYGVALAPHVGIFPIRGLSVAANASLGWSKPEGGVPSTYYGLGPSITYYLSGVGARFYPYAAVRGFYEIHRRKGNIGPDDDPFNIDERDHGWQGVVAMGVAQFVSRNVAITGELYYSRYGSRLDLELSGEPRQVRSQSEDYGLQFGVRVFLF